MTEEIKQDQAAPEAQETPVEIDIRNTPAFKGVIRQLEQAKAEAAALKAAQEKAREESENSKLKEEQNYSALEAKLMAKVAAAEAAANDAKLEAKLSRAGLTHDAALALAKVTYNPEVELDAFVEEFTQREDMQIFLASSKGSTTIPASDGARGAARSQKTDWRQVYQDLKNPGKAAEASQKLEQHFVEFGELPPK